MAGSSVRKLWRTGGAWDCDPWRMAEGTSGEGGEDAMWWLIPRGCRRSEGVCIDCCEQARAHIFQPSAEDRRIAVDPYLLDSGRGASPAISTLPPSSASLPREEERLAEIRDRRLWFLSIDRALSPGKRRRRKSLRGGGRIAGSSAIVSVFWRTPEFRRAWWCAIAAIWVPAFSRANSPVGGFEVTASPDASRRRPCPATLFSSFPAGGGCQAVAEAATGVFLGRGRPFPFVRGFWPAEASPLGLDSTLPKAMERPGRS